LGMSPSPSRCDHLERRGAGVWREQAAAPAIRSPLQLDHQQLHSGFNSGAGISWSPASNVTISNTTFATTRRSGRWGDLLHHRQRVGAHDQQFDL
jgi:hypothetical protein